MSGFWAKNFMTHIDFSVIIHSSFRIEIHFTECKTTMLMTPILDFLRPQPFGSFKLSFDWLLTVWKIPYLRTNHTANEISIAIFLLAAQSVKNPLSTHKSYGHWDFNCSLFIGNSRCEKYPKLISHLPLAENRNWCELISLGEKLCVNISSTYLSSSH